ncbi:MAG: hypothetical protein ABIN24_01925 [Dyadobacter sp.]
MKFWFETGLYWGEAEIRGVKTRPLLAVYQNTSLKNSKRLKNFSTFKTFLRIEFFEKFLVGNYLNTIFYRKNQTVISQDGYEDFIVKCSARKVLIIETKMTHIHAKTIDQMDFAGFKSFVDQDFLAEKSAQTKDKGISQLIRQLKNLSGDDPQLRNYLNGKRADRLQCLSGASLSGF